MNKYSDKIFFFDDLVLYGVLIKLISSKRDGSVGERQPKLKVGGSKPPLAIFLFFLYFHFFCKNN